MLRAWAALIAAAILAGGGCESDEARPEAMPGAALLAPREPSPMRPSVRRARCSTAVANCVVVTGRVLYVEAVDPDGDGDAHYVLAGGSVTAPGLSAVDVAPEHRPRRLPRRGELVSAAGPVRTGSYGQRQVEAVVVHHQRRP
jgi:hypothetical protein